MLNPENSKPESKKAHQAHLIFGGSTSDMAQNSSFRLLLLLLYPEPKLLLLH